MPKSTAAAAGSLASSYASFYKARGDVGSSAPRIEALKERMERDREKRQERLKAIGAAISVTSQVIRPNLQRQRDLETGAKAAGIDMPKQSIGDKFMTAIMGPDTHAAYGQQGVSAGGLMNIGRMAEIFPQGVPKAVEMAREFQSLTPTSRIPTKNLGRPPALSTPQVSPYQQRYSLPDQRSLFNTLRQERMQNREEDNPLLRLLGPSLNSFRSF